MIGNVRVKIIDELAYLSSFEYHFRPKLLSYTTEVNGSLILKTMKKYELLDFTGFNNNLSYIWKPRIGSTLTAVAIYSCNKARFRFRP